ncbi:hypothetical protein PACTADRAFT_76573 [Pachysolen tannophilus NRRL Y-2460]|uniref:Vacuolar membrane protein n=1 Tax=Pachysolen tannophilus NRRL Y-2460 TaxID=669874 RepID=A0A1E4TTA9_PACTA|nr:hypothetical protein PACTADRAFT_76573 [Pachysolen tannophilus NRRL Y-2460]
MSFPTLSIGRDAETVTLSSLTTTTEFSGVSSTSDLIDSSTTSISIPVGGLKEALKFSSRTQTSSSTASESNTYTYTTPIIGVPPSDNNPFILRTNSTSGTVFICFGAISGFILIATFISYMYNSWRANRVTKKGAYGSGSKDTKTKIQNNDEFETKLNLQSEYNLNPLASRYEDYYSWNNNNNNNNNISNNNNRFFISGARPQMSSNHHTRQNSNFSGASTTYYPPNKNDITKMFISPTGEVINVRNNSSYHFQQDSNISMPERPSSTPVLLSSSNIAFGGSNSSINTFHHQLQTQHNRSFSYISPTQYHINDTSPIPGIITNFSKQQQRQQKGRKARSTIPSMFLDNILDSNDQSKTNSIDNE